MMRVILFGLFSTILLVGCSDEPMNVPPAPSSDSELFMKLVNGRLTSDRPEVGLLKLPQGICTATLVAPDVIITAAHCVGYETHHNGGNLGQFNVEVGNSFQSFPISKIISLGQELGANDIAVAKLSVNVPRDMAQPAPVAVQTPNIGNSLTVYGYGCTRRDGVTDGQKREAHFTSGEASAVLCPGDSGGPVFDNMSGSITRINSGYYLGGRGEDVYGDVVLNSGRVIQLIETLSEASNQVPPAGDPSPPSNQERTLCGFHHSVQQDWACGAQGNVKMRCRKGYAPEFEACSGGCVNDASGRAMCSVAAQAPSGPSCGTAYAPYTAWTCTSDGRTVLRCRDGQLDIQRCGSPCLPGDAMGPNGCLP